MRMLGTSAYSVCMARNKNPIICNAVLNDLPPRQMTFHGSGKTYKTPFSSWFRKTGALHRGLSRCVRYL